MKHLETMVCVFILCISIRNESSAQGFLKTSGKQIVNEKGQNVLLRGIGLGGWMLQEGYMLHLNGINPQYSIKNRLAQMIGKEKTHAFYEAWLHQFITKADIDSMHAWGFNSVRLPMHYNLYTLPVQDEPDSLQQTWLQEGFDLTDSLLSWCKANHMYLILDLHAAPGGQGNDLNISDRDSSKPSLWQSPAAQQKTIALWKKLAERYKDEPNIGAYDILNEPNWGFESMNDRNGLKETINKPLRELLMQITTAIRSVDNKHIVIIEGNGWGNNYRGMFPLWDNNIVISYHKYWNSNNVSSIQHMLDTREQQNAPIWLGETGENSNVWFTSAVQLLESHNIGWSWWPLKKLGNNNPLQIETPKSFNAVTNYWNGHTKIAPTPAEVENAIMQLAANTAIRNNRIQYDVIDALFRQPFSFTTKPFVPHIVGKTGAIINAVDYDLGRSGAAYFDKDSGNYSGNPGSRMVGNRGRVYRNDGVDIYEDPSQSQSYYVGSIEEGEWLQYTITVKKTATYKLVLETASTNSNGAVEVMADGKAIAATTQLPATGGETNWQKHTVGTVKLTKGVHVIRVMVDSGGFNWKKWLLEPDQ
ncbi:MAG: cellulase family glycosylhydrolase [Bacteroidetes bacterium]|nr:cellulase family glycosylhydrolase [Bacteroidota bacterium]